MQRNLNWHLSQSRSGASSTSGGGGTTTTISRPGAYSITRDARRGPTQVYRVMVPQNVTANQEFQVYAGSRIVRVRCPPGARPGSSVQITVPADDQVVRASENMAVLTSAEGEGGGGAVRMNSETRIMNASITDESGNSGPGAASGSGSNGAGAAPRRPPQAYNVVVPPNTRPGQTFPASVNGRIINIQCPPNARPGMTVRIVPPPELIGPPPGMQSATNINRPPENAPNSNRSSSPRKTVNQTFEVHVPNGVRPNQQFSLIAGGQRVLVKCPPNARPGTKIRFTLPMPVADDNGVQKNIDVSMKYDTEDGWIRSIRVTDMKFIWIRMDNEGEVMTSDGGFDVNTSAYVKQLSFLQGNDNRMRTGKVSIVPASEHAVDSVIKDSKGKEVADYSEIGMVQKQTFDEKVEWMLKTCKALGVPWGEGHMRICVRRDNLLADSVDAVMSLGQEDMKKIWRFEFMGEQGIDAGGLAKEWFLLVTKALFDPDSGLWLSSEGNQMLMRINPASEVSCPEDHLIYFRFLGRVLGKALFEGQIVSGHMVQYLYKYLLGWPITFDDLEAVDQDLYANLKKLLDMNPDDIEYMCLDFTTTQNLLGESVQISLVPNGEDKAVTGENLSVYLEMYFKYLMLERIKPQVIELLLGFYDVIPEPLLTVFDYQEIELMMCGLPTIDIDDWKKHTKYTGLFENTKARTSACKMFWDIVENEFDQEMKARLLQFVTGTSGVPSRGFSVLQGSDGNIKLFTLNGITMKPGLFPRSHTCFNRLDLPMYKSKAELREKLKIAVTQCATGFTLE
jgi:hypothetical protein